MFSMLQLQVTFDRLVFRANFRSISAISWCYKLWKGRLSSDWSTIDQYQQSELAEWFLLNIDTIRPKNND